MTEKPKILYVEDNVEDRTLVKRVLEAHDYIVLEADDGLEGIEIAQEELPDLILMDINLPEMDGFEVTTKIKSIEGLKNIPVVALTKRVEKGDREMSLIAGCDGYILKPIDVDLLPAQIRAFLAGKREMVSDAEERVYLREYSQKLVDRLHEKLTVERKQKQKSYQAIKRRFNPYISGGPVREPNMFFGREELLKRIINTLHNNSIMIHGPRRIGKTSLLYQLADRLRAASDPDYAFIPALIDLEGTTQEEFFHTLMEEILEDCQPYLTERLPLVYNEKDEKAYTHRDFARDLSTLIDYLQQKSDKEVRLILLLDEVDVMNRYDQLVQQQLRRIFMKTFARSLGAVVAGVHISKEWERLESPWYNLFLEMRLSPLSREETIRLIKEPVEGVYSYEDEAVEAIWEYSQGHPQRVQQLCLEAVNRLLQEKRSRVTKADMESVYQEIVAWERAQEEQGERERARPLVKRVAEEGLTYEAEEGTDV
jgi:CheY-like chemotaxis protein